MKKFAWRHPAVGFTLFGTMVLSCSARAAVPSFSEAPAALGDSNFCIGKDDGSYRHSDCRVYYSCDGGIASQVACPAGQVFDAARNRDNDPARSYCGTPDTVAHVDCSGIALKK